MINAEAISFGWSVILLFFNITQCFSMFHKMGFSMILFPSSTQVKQQR